MTVVPPPPALARCVGRAFRGAVFLPTAGEVCLASCLSGGDYDGDHFQLMTDPALVSLCISYILVQLVHQRMS